MKSIIALLTLTAAALAADDPCRDRPALDEWLTCRLSNRMAENMKQAATEKQTQSPSAAASSTTLLDRTSGPDLVSAAVRLLGSGSGNGSQSGDFTATASAYALFSAATGANPLAPTTYDAGLTARRFFFTLGHENVEAKNDPMSGPNKVVGTKVLILNYRDVSTASNKQAIAKLIDPLGAASQDFANLTDQVRLFLEARLPARMGLTVTTPEERIDFESKYLHAPELGKTLDLLTAEERSQIEQLIFKSPSSASYEKLAAQVKDVVERIRRKPQLSLGYTARISEAQGGPTLHRGELIFDVGVNAWSNLTVNAGFDYLNSSKVGADFRTGRVAAEGQIELNHAQAIERGVRPYLLAFSLESKWNNVIDPIYRVQGRLEIPLTRGITLPISVTRSNRTELIKEAEVKGQFGFTIDVARLASLFTTPK